MNALPIYIGYDPTQRRAYDVAGYSAQRAAIRPVHVQPLVLQRLQCAGLYTRPTVRHSGILFDERSNAPMSTEFALSRFLVPLLAQSGPAIFVDSDVLFIEDPWEMLASVNWQRYAVSVVKHVHNPSREHKMAGQAQAPYARKNWSSVMLFNTDHPAWRHLSLERFNTLRGLQLHQFDMLADHEIGDLHPRWNVLVDEGELPYVCPALLHYTLGGPWLRERNPRDCNPEADEVWLSAERAFKETYHVA